jgi:hypothetical protein
MTTQPFVLRFAIDGLTHAGTTTVIGMAEQINKLEKRGNTSRAPQICLHLLPRAPKQWKIVLAHKAGIIVVVDSASPQNFPAVQSLIQAIRKESDAPLIILANKQDHPEALKPDAIRKQLELGSHVPVLPCIAKRMSSVMGTMRQLSIWASAEA